MSSRMHLRSKYLLVGNGVCLLLLLTTAMLLNNAEQWISLRVKCRPSSTNEIAHICTKGAVFTAWTKENSFEWPEQNKLINSEACQLTWRGSQLCPIHQQFQGLCLTTCFLYKHPLPLLHSWSDWSNHTDKSGALAERDLSLGSIQQSKHIL